VDGGQQRTPAGSGDSHQHAGRRHSSRWHERDAQRTAARRCGLTMAGSSAFPSQQATRATAMQAIVAAS